MTFDLQRVILSRPRVTIDAKVRLFTGTREDLSHTTLSMDVEAVNGLSCEDFVRVFGNAVERCPVVPAAVWAGRPFPSGAALEAAFTAFIDALPESGSAHTHAHARTQGRTCARACASLRVCARVHVRPCACACVRVCVCAT